MTYNLFPAVDENFDFPEDVRIQLAKSPQLRNLVVPMTEEIRDGLTEEESWVGRTIYNTTANILESCTEFGVWRRYVDENFDFPEPDPLWDENYDILPEIRVQLAKTPELRNMIVPMTQMEVEALTAPQRWDGRTIFNTTYFVLQTWKAEKNLWIKSVDENNIFSMYEWKTWTPVLTIMGAGEAANYTAQGRYMHDDSIVTAAFNIQFTGDIQIPENGSGALMLTAPPIQISEAYSNQDWIGNAIFDQLAALGSRFAGYTEIANFGAMNYKIMFKYISAENEMTSVESKVPQIWKNGCSIKGQIIYDSK